MLVNGDKLVVTKKVAGFLNEGDIVKVVNVDEKGMITFAFGDGFLHMGLMNDAECKEHFEKVKEEVKAASVTEERIDEIMANSEFTIQTVFNKCTIVACKLPNGFVIVESSACVSPENYNKEMGIDICLDRIEDKIWELEGYRLQEELYRNNGKASDCCCNCDECEPEDECLGTDLDCDNCEDYDCPFNTNN